MATQPRSLAETCFTLNDFARYLSRHVVTVRKWFENDPHVIRTPRGGQRDQIQIPIEHALTRCRQMGVPESLLERMVEEHGQQLTKASVKPPGATLPLTRTARSKESVKSVKSAKPKPRSKSRRT